MAITMASCTATCWPTTLTCAMSAATTGPAVLSSLSAVSVPYAALPWPPSDERPFNKELPPMITITPNAAKQIRKASEQADAEDMYLRLAAKREDGGGIEYGMGFEYRGGQDQTYTSGGIAVLIFASCK